MTSILNPYLTFADSTRTAMEFYRDVFGGELTVMTFGDMGGEPVDGVMHSQLATPSGFTLMASDMPPGDTPPGTTGQISISLSGDDEADLTGWFEKLADAGTVLEPLRKQAWGDAFGMCSDRFGITWLVNISGKAAG
jgi:PhnB protein